MTAYVDTSALAKWYLNEHRSQEFVAWIQGTAPVAISSLTALEMRSLLARRRREGDLDGELESKIFATFEEDIASGHISRHTLEDGSAEAAVRLISTFPQHPLRSLDALHLTIARDLKAEFLATADRTMAGAAQSMGFDVVDFS